MRLYLVQHGEAAEETEDPTRPLTENGRAAVQRVAAAADDAGVRPMHVFHSGKLRAEQTAEIIAETLGLAGSVGVAAGLKPMDDVEPWATQVGEHVQDVMLVGHLPFMGRLASLLLCGDADTEIVHFRYGAVVCLGREDTGSWSLLWVLAPDLV